MARLERHTLLTITTKLISKVAEVMGDIESTGIRIDWLDRLIKEMHKEKKMQRARAES